MTDTSASTLKATLHADLNAAMRQRDQVRTGTLRMVLTAVTNEEVSGTSARELSDDEVLKVVVKEAKKRREAATAYTDAGRPELAEKEVAELAVLEAYLPAQLSDDELRGAGGPGGAVHRRDRHGADGPGHEGRAAAGRRRAEGGRVAAAVKKALAG